MDGSGSGQREMQSPPVSTLCVRPGCVFYAHSLFDGMCSKCYKDVNQQTSGPCNAAGSSAVSATSSASNSPVTSNASCQTSSAAATTSGASADISSNINSNAVDTDSVSTTSDVSATMPVAKDLAISTSANSSEKTTEATSSADIDSPTSGKDKVKKKRCDVCKKRVGLTGFDCRCGGHYCSLHRYSDTHSCGFDYRELAQTEIRRQNPVVAAEKVKKI